jgi:hypothetical protein
MPENCDLPEFLSAKYKSATEGLGAAVDLETVVIVGVVLMGTRR